MLHDCFQRPHVSRCLYLVNRMLTQGDDGILMTCITGLPRVSCNELLL